jgi:hypothetical protein
VTADEAHALVSSLLPVADALPLEMLSDVAGEIDLEAAAAVVARTAGDWPEGALALGPFIVSRGFAHAALVAATGTVARRVREGSSTPRDLLKDEESFFIAGAGAASAAAALSASKVSAKKRRTQAKVGKAATGSVEAGSEEEEEEEEGKADASPTAVPTRYEAMAALLKWQSTLPPPLARTLAAALLPSVVAAHGSLLAVGSGATARVRAAARAALEEALDCAYHRLKVAAKAADTLREKWDAQGLGGEELQRELHDAVLTGPGAVVVELLLRLAADPPRLHDAGLSSILPGGEVLELQRADRGASAEALSAPLARLLKTRALAAVHDEELRAALAHAASFALMKSTESALWAGEFVVLVETRLMEACGQVR